MKFTQPKLPYAPDALAPVISQRTIEYHWGKHEKTYIDTLNSLIEGTGYEDMPLEQIVTNSEGKLFNNAAQTWNHIFYFFQFSPDPIKEPAGRLREQIDKQFGSFDELKRLMEEAGKTLWFRLGVAVRRSGRQTYNHAKRQCSQSNDGRIASYSDNRRLGARLLP